MSIPAGNKELRFAVENWAALAPGLSTQQEWLTWFGQPKPLAREFTPDLAWMAAGLRRRVSPLGRAALNVLATCQPVESCPVVLASRYGDLASIAGLLTQLHQEGSVSPMGFSLSVHNAAAGVYSIARQDRTTTISIAARSDLAEAACFEAMGWLASGASRVLVVCCEDAVPPPYLAEGGGQEFRHAWACRLRAVPSGGISLGIAGNSEAPQADSLQAESSTLGALEFLVAGRGRSLTSDTGRYLWQRHD